MAFFDLPYDQLVTYRPERNEPADFDAFWQRTLDEARAHPLEARFTPVDFGLRLFETFDLVFAGYAGQRVRGWLILPHDSGKLDGQLACVVNYIGYGGGRGFPLDWLSFAAAGYATLVMDTRGQGSTWRNGDTPDVEPDGSNAQFPGFMTRGVLKPETYYYRRVFTDAVRAVETARSHPAIDPQRVVVTGGSQGGGISLAVAGLVPDIAACLPDVPYLCHYRRATTITDEAPYSEIANYCKIHRDQVETVFRTLSYFDGLNFATRARAASLFSVGLMDTIVPPSTVFAAYNYYAGPKDIRTYEYNNHEGGETFQTIEQIKFLQCLRT